MPSPPETAPATAPDRPAGHRGRPPAAGPGRHAHAPHSARRAEDTEPRGGGAR
ncbi:hypothetical protein ABZY14_16845 [Streptomyces sp. NPDC006617]|uniref:hypothetical protein n=1 Tax=Streptomyces sp. NPDC006617 TaxID=3155354 RepID=UPI0033B37EB3